MALTRVKNPGNFTVDGSVGIGISSFNSKLEVKGVSSNGSVRVIPNSDNAEASIGYYQDTAGTNMTDRWVAGVGGWGNTNQFTIGNSGSPKLKIDTSGRVTTPNQPAFHASGGSQQTAVGIVQFITLMTNTGNHYNSSNYRFTAPTTGVYKFSARIMKAQNATVDFHFRVNGSQVGDNIYDTATATNQLNSGTVNMVRHLNSGDYVQVYSASTSAVNWIHAGHREFSGYLIG